MNLESELSPPILHSLIDGMESSPDMEWVDEAIAEFEEWAFFISSHPSTVARRSRLTVTQAENLLFESRKWTAENVVENPGRGIAA